MTINGDKTFIKIVIKHPFLYDSVYKYQVMKENAWKEVAEFVRRRGKYEEPLLPVMIKS